MNIHRRNFLRTTGIGAAAAAVQGCASAPTALFGGRKRPNIVVILADDLGYGDLSCLNNDSKINTPNMDALANDGVIFTDAHSPSAVCTPTRYGILTGRYAWRSRLKNGVLWGWSPPLVEPSRLTLASMLKSHGYRTGCVGKWHLGLGWQTTTGRVLSDRTNETGQDVDYGKPIKGGPNDLGFDYFFGIPASLDMVPYVYIENDRVVDAPTDTTENSPYPAYYRGGPIAPGFTMESVLPTLTQKSVDFIDSHYRRYHNKPFFLYVPLASPHTPWVPNDFVKGKSRAGVYGDFVMETDWAVGRIIDTLKKHEMYDDTLIIITSDNGSHTDHIGKHNNGNSTGSPNFGHHANHLFRGQKADIWDGGHRVPFIARWGGVTKKGTRCSDTICLADFMATFAEIVSYDLKDNEGPDSFNILPCLQGGELHYPLREATVHHSLRGMYSIRKGEWKLVQGLGSGGFTQPAAIEPEEGGPQGQLYNVMRDINEEINLYDERPDIVQELSALLEKYQTQGYSRML